RYHADLIGGKGGTRTLDPGIMSAFLGSQVSDFSTFGQAAVAAKCLKVHRRAGEIPANLPRARMYCGEQTSRPCAPLLPAAGTLVQRSSASNDRSYHPAASSRAYRTGPDYGFKHGSGRTETVSQSVR